MSEGLSTPEGDHIYPGGSMTPEEFMAAEFRVDADLPPYEKTGMPAVEVKEGNRKFILNPMNSAVVKYGEDENGFSWEMYNHIVMPDDTLRFYKVDEKYQILVKTMLEQDLPLLLHYREPVGEVKDALEKRIRGAMTMAEIILRIMEAESE